MNSLAVSPNLSLPPDTVTSTLVAYGAKGMGKTNFGAVLAEELFMSGMRWAWLDPLGVGWGIKYDAAGTGKGVPCIILGGTRGDIPITPADGALVADFVVEGAENVLIDFSRKASGEMWSIGEKIRFVNAYARRLFQRQGDIVDGRRREPLFQILDEAARYVPQTIPAGNADLAMCVAAWQQFVEEGRNVGLGVALLTQRSARLNKDVAELCDAMVAFRTVGPNSVRAILDWLGEHVEKERHKEIASQLRKLPRGTALVVSPGWLETEAVVPIRFRRTFDSSATPKPGERLRNVNGVGNQPDLEAARARFAANITAANDNDPKALRARIRELENALSRETSKSITPTEPVRVEVPLFDEKAFGSLFERSLDALGSVGTAVQDARALLGEAMNDYRREAKAAGEKAGPQPARPFVATGTWTAPPTRKPELVAVGGGGSKPPRMTVDRRILASRRTVNQRILTILAQHAGGMNMERLALHLGVHPRTKSFTNAVGELRGQGFVEGCEITPTGRIALGPYDPLPTGPALLDFWCNERLAPAEARILRTIANSGRWTVDSLADHLGVHPRTKSFTNTLGKLRGLGLVDGVMLSEELAG